MINFDKKWRFKITLCNENRKYNKSKIRNKKINIDEI